MEELKNLMSIGFDGYIASNGNYIELDQKVLSDIYINDQDFQMIEQILSKYSCDYYVQCHDGLYWSKKQKMDTLSYYGITEEQLNQTIFGIFKLLEERTSSINKIFFQGDKDLFLLLQKQLSPAFYLTYLNENIEIMKAQCNKETGIQKILDCYKNQDIVTYAIGDSNSDRTMFYKVNYKIAMGNGEDELKKEADYITSSIEEDGIYLAFAHFKLI